MDEERIFKKLPSTRLYSALVHAIREHHGWDKLTPVQQLEFEANLQEDLKKIPIDEDRLKVWIKDTYEYRSANNIISRANQIVRYKNVDESKSKTRQEIIKLIYDGKTHDARNELAKWLIIKHQLITIEETGDVYYYTKGYYRPLGEAFIEKEIETIWPRPTKRQVAEIVASIKRKSYKRTENVESDLRYVCLNNCILDTETGETMPHSQDKYFFGKLPVNYDPEADCEEFKRFLSEVLNKDDLPIIQEYIGYCFYRKYNFHKAMMFLGDGCNGKTVLLNIVKCLLGHDNVCSVALQDMELNRFSASEFYQKMANIFGDLSPNALESTSRFKLLTGEDVIQAERKFGQPFKFVNYAKIFFSCNNLPPVKDTSKGLFRRWIILKFPHNFEGREDDGLTGRLTEPSQLSGVLNWALEGLSRLLKNKGFSFSQSTEETKREYLRLSDSVMAFVEDLVGYNPNVKTLKDDVYDRYLAYCSDCDMVVSQESSFWKSFKMYANRKIVIKRKRVDGVQKGYCMGLSFKDSEELKFPQEMEVSQLSELSRLSNHTNKCGKIINNIKGSIEKNKEKGKCNRLEWGKDLDSPYHPCTPASSDVLEALDIIDAGDGVPDYQLAQALKTDLDKLTPILKLLSHKGDIREFKKGIWKLNR